MIRCTIFYINIVRASCAAVEKRGSCRRHTCRRRRRPADDSRIVVVNMPVSAPSTTRPLRAPNRSAVIVRIHRGFICFLGIWNAVRTTRPTGLVRAASPAGRPSDVFMFSDAHRCAERSAGRISHPSNQFHASPPHRSTPQRRDLGDWYCEQFSMRLILIILWASGAWCLKAAIDPVIAHGRRWIQWRVIWSFETLTVYFCSSPISCCVFRRFRRFIVSSSTTQHRNELRPDVVVMRHVATRYAILTLFLSLVIRYCRASPPARVAADTIGTR